MPMDLIHGMQAFVTLANAGSFTETGRRLNLTTAQVSRTIAALESHLGVRPLNRTTRFMGLTEAGERYLSRARDIMVAIDVSEREAHGARSHPHGRWRVHCSTSIANHFVIPLIVRFQTRYPDVSVDLTLAPHLPTSCATVSTSPRRSLSQCARGRESACCQASSRRTIFGPAHSCVFCRISGRKIFACFSYMRLASISMPRRVRG